jgi:hypothetical protein
MQSFGFDTELAFHYENGFYLATHLKRMGKLLAHYELYKQIVDLPGEVVECGVFKGASLMRFASFRNLLESPYSRRLIGFDAFGNFPRQGDAADQAFIDAFENEAGTGIAADQLRGFLAHKGIDNVELVPGDINKTVPSYAQQHPALKIALLHVDVDVYQPTRIILETFHPMMVRGGVMVFDDYGTVAGETRAIDEFLRDTGMRPNKLPCSHIPSFVRID